MFKIIKNKYYGENNYYLYYNIEYSNNEKVARTIYDTDLNLGGEIGIYDLLYVSKAM